MQCASWGGLSSYVTPSRVKREMWHRSVLDSRYVSGEALRKYAKTRKEYPLACSICAASVKHDKTSDVGFLLHILEDVKTFVVENEKEI